MRINRMVTVANLVAPCLRAGRGLKQGFLLGHFDFALSPRACVRGAD